MMFFLTRLTFFSHFYEFNPNIWLIFDRFDQHSDGSEERTDGGVACPADRWRRGYTAQGLQPLPNQSK